jgi:hypothetical protein
MGTFRQDRQGCSTIFDKPLLHLNELKRGAREVQNRVLTFITSLLDITGGLGDDDHTARSGIGFAGLSIR